MLSVLNSTHKTMPDFAGIHLDACIRLLEQCQDGGGQNIPSMVYHGVKFINHSNTNNLTSDGIMRRFTFIEHIKAMIGLLTPAELIRIFPPIKDFHGHKYGCKDYFYTMNALRKHGLNKPIGDQIDHILWDYVNMHINRFVVAEMGMLSDIRRLEGQPGILEEFAAENGLTVYRKYTDSEDREFMQNTDTGEIQRVHKKRPRYLQPVG